MHWVNLRVTLKLHLRVAIKLYLRVALKLHLNCTWVAIKFCHEFLSEQVGQIGFHKSKAVKKIRWLIYYRLFDLLISYLICWLIIWIISWFFYCFDLLNDYLIYWLIEFLIYSRVAKKDKDIINRLNRTKEEKVVDFR